MKQHEDVPEIYEPKGVEHYLGRICSESDVNFHCRNSITLGLGDYSHYVIKTSHCYTHNHEDGLLSYEISHIINQNIALLYA